MQSWKLAGALGAAAAALLSGHAAFAVVAQGDTVVFAGAGSSAQFVAFEKSAIVTLGTGAQHWSASNGASIVDTGAANEVGNIWVAWAGTANSRVIYYFVSVDSTVGVRAFFNRDSTFIATPAPAPGNINAGITGDVALPSDVQTDVTSTAINAGLTDIRPEDALVATNRALNVLGYSAATPIFGAEATGNGTAGGGRQANPVAFRLSNRPFIVSPIGAVPIVVLVNNSLSNVTNVTRFTLSRILGGQFFRTSDLDPTISVAAAQPLTAYVREPLSGTYNTAEFCIPSSVEGGTSQEAGVTSNPLNEAGLTLAGNGTFASGTSNGGRVRVIGTGDMINAVGSTANSIGYAFWNSSSFSSANALKTHYITVDGADPLVTGYPSTAPVTSSNYPGTPTFNNVINGGYPAWSLLRAVTDAGSNSSLSGLFAIVTNGTANADFAAPNALRVFRSHRAVPALLGNPLISPNNGVIGVAGEGVNAEAGSDVGGAVFSLNNEAATVADFGTGLTNVRQ